MRLYNEDIAKLFPLVPVGAPVHLVNQPIKLGWEGNKLYMEVSQPLDEDVGISPHDPDDNISKEQLAREDAQRSSFLMRLANSEIQKQKDKGASVNMDKVRRAIDKPTGIPVVIGGNGSGWQQAAESDEGLAPIAQEEDPNKSALDAQPSKSSRSAPTAAVPAARAPARSYDPAPAPADASEEFYSPATPYRPSRTIQAEPVERPADAMSSPYPDEADVQTGGRAIAFGHLAGPAKQEFFALNRQKLLGLCLERGQSVFVDEHGLQFQPFLPRLGRNVFINLLSCRAGKRRFLEARGFFAGPQAFDDVGHVRFFELTG
jgi:hypothetical protein